MTPSSEEAAPTQVVEAPKASPIFKDAEAVETLIQVTASAARKKGWSEGQVGTFITVAKSVLPGLENQIAPGGNIPVGTLLGVTDATK